MLATAKDLRFHTKELLDTVARGEEVIITFHGKPYAKLAPISVQSEKAANEEDELFGIWKNNRSVANVDKYVRSIRKGRFL